MESAQQVANRFFTYFENQGYRSFDLKVVQSNYYDLPLEERAKILQAPEQYLCKTLLMENSEYDPSLANPFYPQYIAVLVQYQTSVNAEKLMKFMRSLNTGIGKKKFNFRLASEEIAYQISGYRYNSLTPYMMNSRIPLIISKSIVELPGQFLWLGGGHVDVKLRLGLQELVDKYDDAVYFADIVYD